MSLGVSVSSARSSMIAFCPNATRNRPWRASPSGTSTPSRLRRVPTRILTCGRRPSGTMRSDAIATPFPPAASSSASIIKVLLRSNLPMSATRRSTSTETSWPASIPSPRARARAQSSSVLPLVWTATSIAPGGGTSSSPCVVTPALRAFCRCSGSDP